MYESWAVWISKGTLRNLVKDCQNQKSFKCNCPEGSVSPEFANLGELNVFIIAFRSLLIDKYLDSCSTLESIQELISKADENYKEFSSIFIEMFYPIIEQRNIYTNMLLIKIPFKNNLLA